MDVLHALKWVSAYPWLYCTGSLFIFFILLLSSVIVPNAYAGPAVVSALFVLLGIASDQKLATRGEPLFPWDLMLLKNAEGMSKITSGMISPLAIGGRCSAGCRSGRYDYQAAEEPDQTVLARDAGRDLCRAQRMVSGAGHRSISGCCSDELSEHLLESEGELYAERVRVCVRRESAAEPDGQAGGL
ncbi:hypothetical protein ACFSQ7_29945 [Paenibacillus rhizoplanae]